MSVIGDVLNAKHDVGQIVNDDIDKIISAL